MREAGSLRSIQRGNALAWLTAGSLRLSFDAESEGRAGNCRKSYADLWWSRMAKKTASIQA
jgi:hypothetical protein